MVAWHSSRTWRTAHVSEGVDARRIAVRALVRIADEGAYANLLLPTLLERSSLDQRDRGLVTELVYGTTRMQRACDHLVDRFVLGDTDPQVRAALRLGAYQLHFLRIPSHAAVSATVSAVRGRGRGLVNAVLRRVASAGDDVAWPDLATELSYPDWIVEVFLDRLGSERGRAALVAMNQPAETHQRDDGYIQDPASTLVVELLGAEPGERVIDLCAAPGGKATALAGRGVAVVAADSRPNRARLVSRNARKTETTVPVVVADGRHPPFRAGSADRVLVDAPCSGLGSLRRRPDARWRIDADAPIRLADIQVELVRAGLGLLRPGGTLLYSVCTLTEVETVGVLERVLAESAGVRCLDPEPVVTVPGETDGMVSFRLTTPT